MADSSFWFGYLVRAILTACSLAILAALATSLLAILAALATSLLAILAALATSLLAVTAASGAPDEVTYGGIKMTCNAAANTVYTTGSYTYDTLRCICNSAD